MQCLEKNAYNQIWRYTHWQWLFKNNLHMSSWCRSASHACCTVLCSVLEPGTIHGNQRFLTCSAWLDLGLSLVLTDSWLVCLPSWVGSLLSSISELVKRIGLELAQLKKKRRKKEKFSVLFLWHCWAAYCLSTPLLYNLHTCICIFRISLIVSHTLGTLTVWHTPVCIRIYTHAWTRTHACVHTPIYSQTISRCR